jgi:hypothetical protein
MSLITTHSISAQVRRFVLGPRRASASCAQQGLGLYLHVRQFFIFKASTGFLKRYPVYEKWLLLLDLW